MSATSAPERTMGMWSATGTGVGAIVGGGILALAGVALAEAGPAAILAFALNGVIAVLTALSFSELASAFPQSGGTYTFAKRVLSVEAAFAVGWVVWFASVVAAVLYAIGFGFFFAVALSEIGQATGHASAGRLLAPSSVAAFAVLATVFYAVGLARRAGGGGQWVNFGKVVVFVVLIGGGFLALLGRPAGQVSEGLTPFLAGGWGGLARAMGFTFIALQGFDLIAAVGGEVKDPERVLPRSMLLSLGLALAIYLPLLFVVVVVGTASGESIQDASAQDPEAIVAIAAKRFLGPFGYWLVIVAGVLSMLSALRANLFAASRVAMTMARDRTLPHVFSTVHPVRRTPVAAIVLTLVLVLMIVLLVGDVASAGAAASLIFLVTFALAHGIAFLARRRGGSQRKTFRTPFFPLVPVLGGTACILLAVFEGVSVPQAGVIGAVWLGVGGVLFLALFGRRARVVDESTAARDPEAARLRGRSPLVLVPIANPSHVAHLAMVASALAPPHTGRVMMLSVVVTPPDWDPSATPEPLQNAQSVLREALVASHGRGIVPVALTTIAPRPWPEIARVARAHGCESLVLGLSDLARDADGGAMSALMESVRCDVVVLRTPHGWDLDDVRRVTVPVGGRGGHDRLRARLLGSLLRTGDRTVHYLRVVPTTTAAAAEQRARRDLRRIALDEAPGQSEVDVVREDDTVRAIAEHAADSDLLVLGVQRLARGRRAFGRFTLAVAGATQCPLLLISRGP